MLTHQEDGTEVEMKITSDGTLVIHCSRCNRVWVDTFQLVHVVTGGVRVSRTEKLSLVSPRAMGSIIKKQYLGVSGATGAREYSMIVRQDRKKAINSAKKAFPELFQ